MGSQNRSCGYDEQQMDGAVAALSTSIEPVMITIMDAVAEAVILALYLPIVTPGRMVTGGFG